MVQVIGRMYWFLLLLVRFVPVSSEHLVQKCPVNKTDWSLASARRGCNKTHPYHCLPNSNLSSLVELCYKKTYFIKGCLKLLDNGYVDKVECDGFVCGCPDAPYFGHELYKYPKCLDLNTQERCFAADTDCLKLTFCNTSDHCDTSTKPVTPECICNDTLSTAIWTAIVTAVIIYVAPRVKGWCTRGSAPSMSERLEEACREGDAEKYLNLKKEESLTLLFAAVNENGWNFLHHASYGGNASIFKDLLENEKVNISQINHEKGTVLHIASKYGRKEICELILENEEHNSLLNMKDDKHMNAGHLAAWYGHIDVLELLITAAKSSVLKKVDNTEQENIAILACKGKSLDTLKFIGNHPEVRQVLHETNFEGWNVAHYAAKSGNDDMLEYLINEKKVDCVNASTTDEKTCLHTACEKGHYEACKSLVRMKPSILRLKDKNGKHAGHYAAMNGSVRIIKYLKDRGLELDKNDNENHNILHIACLHGKLELCKYLAKEFPNFLKQKTEKKSYNAALFVVEGNDDENTSIKILDFLVNKGLDIYTVSASGKSVPYLACEKKLRVLYEYLMKKYPQFYEIDYGDMDPIEAVDGDKKFKAIQRKYDPKTKSTMFTGSQLLDNCIIL
ncbi:uncharacterized protein LOC125670263 isoform X2 [Ostrea edulis]|uniref:uncharacterized protein LOC125670263 isoform X2 n=1 Tax=Ostrea edulis TaxID=37623 RepID=UPI0024AED95D|nr:uncharacterized protein LOC125670263 isoform X2 [Ostrea edulis]XP_056017722.1 uncharacterized protein LOC125670263 isoform X2 [Ostrea edulis]